MQRVQLEAVKAAKAHGILPHEFLLMVARGEPINGHTPTFSERVDAAKAAAPYYAPKLMATDVTVRRVSSIDDLTDQDLIALAGSTGIAAQAKSTRESPGLH